MGTNTFVNLPTVNLGYAATIFAASPAALSTLKVAGPLTEGGYANGQTAWCASTNQLFILQAAVGTADGKLVLATADDPSRQWVYNTVIGGTGSRVYMFTPEIDFTQVQTFTVIPPINFRGTGGLQPRALITQKDGTVNTAPTLGIGANAAINDINGLVVTAALATQAVNTVVNIASPANPALIYDFSQFGVRCQITSGAVLGTATVFKGRIYVEISIFS